MVEMQRSTDAPNPILKLPVILNDWLHLTKFYAKFGVQYRRLIAAGTLGALGVVFGILSITFLFPMLSGLINNDFESQINLPVVGLLIQQWPDVFSTANSIFLLDIGILMTLGSFQAIGKYGMKTIILNESLQLTRRMQLNAIERILNYDLRYFDSRSPNGHGKFVVNEIRIACAKLNNVTQTLTLVVIISAHSIILFVLSWQLALAAILIFPTIGFLSSKIVWRWVRDGEKSIATKGGVDLQIRETIAKIPTVKSLGRDEFIQSSLSSAIEAEVSEAGKLSWYSGAAQPTAELTSLLSLVLVVSIIPTLIGLDSMSGDTSKFFLFLFIARATAPKLNDLFAQKVPLSKGRANQIEVEQFFDATHPYLPVKGHVEKNEFLQELSFNNLHFNYGNETTNNVLKGVTFDVKKGNLVAIVGRSGEGKTTLLNVLLRNYPIENGMAFIDGIDLNELTKPALHQIFTYVGQSPLIQHGTIRDGILFGEPAAPDLEERLNKAIDASGLRSLIDDLPLGLETVIGRDGRKFSGGETQRFTMARALVKSSPIVLMDEPTSQLDNLKEKEILDIISRLTPEKTIILVTHRLGSIVHADEIVVLSGGEVVEQGTYESLSKQSGLFQELLEAKS